MTALHVGNPAYDYPRPRTAARTPPSSFFILHSAFYIEKGGPSEAELFIEAKARCPFLSFENFDSRTDSDT